MTCSLAFESDLMLLWLHRLIFPGRCSWCAVVPSQGPMRAVDPRTVQHNWPSLAFCPVTANSEKKVSIDKWRINFKSLDALLAFVWLSVNDC